MNYTGLSSNILFDFQISFNEMPVIELFYNFNLYNSSRILYKYVNVVLNMFQIHQKQINKMLKL